MHAAGEKRASTGSDERHRTIDRHWSRVALLRTAPRKPSAPTATPTRSRWLRQRNASAAALAVAWSNLVHAPRRRVASVPPQPCFTPSVPKDMLADPSTRIITSRLVSWRYSLTYSLSLRPKTFQSRWRMLSPAVYWRCAANSTAIPCSGDWCMPFITPSATIFARSSNGASCASVSGERYCSARRPVVATAGLTAPAWCGQGPWPSRGRWIRRARTRAAKRSRHRSSRGRPAR